MFADNHQLICYYFTLNSLYCQLLPEVNEIRFFILILLSSISLMTTSGGLIYIPLLRRKLVLENRILADFYTLSLPSFYCFRAM